MVRCLFLCLGDSDKQSIYNQRREFKSIVVNMLQNWSNMYSNHSSNIKCVGTTIKYIDFESIHYTLNLDDVSSFIVYNDFDYMFLSIYCWFESIKLFFS